MKVLMTGGTGFIGQALIPALQAKGHQITVLSRQSAPPSQSGVTYLRQLDELKGSVDAVINLAGASLAAKRWSPAYKQEMLDSRVGLTRGLGVFFEASGAPPKVWLNASAIGYYGPREEDLLDEDAAPGEGFAAELCKAWEEAALAAAGDARTCLMRLGVVLDSGGGAYPQMAQPFKMGIANWIGSGRQWLSWVHRRDVVSAFCYALDHPDLTGPVNVTAPEPVTSRGFCDAMRQVHRTLLAVPMPALVMRAMVGEMADELLLTGQRVLPARLQAAGFVFDFPTLGPALTTIKNA
ncbi:MAG: TIGR01777 family oxidoreductase [Congregibacter sp.]|nr:TIGR01777 family oxidoreductase [Congregibacter sp.]